MTRMHALVALIPLAACSSLSLSGDDPTTSIAQAICPPPTLFDYAVCVCENLDHVGALTVKPSSSGVGSVGVNGKTAFVGYADISGDFVAYAGLSAVGATIGDSLVTKNGVESVGDLHIGNDATIGGDLTCVGNVEIAGSLGLGGHDQVVGTEIVGSRATYAAPSLPCNCDPSTFFDVDAAVAAAKQSASGASSWTHVGAAEIHLTGGNYYVTSADVVGLTAIYVDASSSVFVDGSLASVGATQWHLAASATLDLFVSGNVASVGQLIAGSPANPGAFRLYIGGTHDTTVGSVGDARFYGSIYAPRSAVAYVGDALIVGSIFARTIQGVGALEVDYDAAAQQPTSCDPPPPDGSDSDGPVT